MLTDRVVVGGKYFAVDGQKWFVRGMAYGPFAPNARGEHLPESSQLRADFDQIGRLGANCIRVYHPPTRAVLDAAGEARLRVFVDVPWQKHRCFFEDWDARRDALERVRATAAELRDHPALFAISVGNEIPADVIRYYGAEPVAGFIEQLIDVVKQESPTCLATYVNFPTTEFLVVDGCDFTCFNVYLHDPEKLGAYLDRLQHLAGNHPLVLGEYGIDSLRNGEERQAQGLVDHLSEAYRRGLAGAFAFSFTDDWYTGGSQIDDWAFGLTRRDRAPKPAAAAVEHAWRQLPKPLADPPRVSVVVCSYNGAATLRQCLMSLMELDYPDYEVILVDDGSTDDTAEIAADFPQVVYHGQPNEGLSVARNVGAELATGEIVAYTDSDCIVDVDWLHYLVQAMRDQRVEAIGGPNITPPSDGWIAKCVAASPGNPSHVMLDDRLAEHVPGCNMAFRRATLLGIGGFDPQFRQAGDDVDLCWRLLDANIPIGYASGAMVWHKRRATVRAYVNQQRGYGRSEAMVRFKHPERCGALGRATWRGIIYGDGAVGLPLSPQLVYHGRFGSGPFQTIYRSNEYAARAAMSSLEWHFAAIFLLSLGVLWLVPAYVGAFMEATTAALAVHSARRAPLPRRAPLWCRPLVACLYWLQPIIRGWSRMTYLVKQGKPPQFRRSERKLRRRLPANLRGCNYFAESNRNLGREALLDALVTRAKAVGWTGDFDNAWAEWDVKLDGDFWHDMTIRTATEELGWPRRFTRCRCAAIPTTSSKMLVAAVVVWSAAAALALNAWALAICCAVAVACIASLRRSRRHCLTAALGLVHICAKEAGLETPGGGAGAVDSANGSPPGSLSGPMKKVVASFVHNRRRARRRVGANQSRS